MIQACYEQRNMCMCSVPIREHRMLCTLQEPRCSFFGSHEVFKAVRSNVLSMVLHSDMARHFGVLQRLKQRALAEPQWWQQQGDVQLAMQAALKCGDLYHLTLDSSLHRQWVAKLEEVWSDIAPKDI